MSTPTIPVPGHSQVFSTDVHELDLASTHDSISFHQEFTQVSGGVGGLDFAYPSPLPVLMIEYL